MAQEQTRPEIPVSRKIVGVLILATAVAGTGLLAYWRVKSAPPGLDETLNRARRSVGDDKLRDLLRGGTFKAGTYGIRCTLTSFIAIEPFIPAHFRSPDIDWGDYEIEFHTNGVVTFDSNGRGREFFDVDWDSFEVRADRCRAIFLTTIPDGAEQWDQIFSDLTGQLSMTVKAGFDERYGLDDGIITRYGEGFTWSYSSDTNVLTMSSITREGVTEDPDFYELTFDSNGTIMFGSDEFDESSGIRTIYSVELRARP